MKHTILLIALTFFSSLNIVFSQEINSTKTAEEEQLGSLFVQEIKLADKFFQEENYSSSILHYERARKFDSTNPLVIRNLSSAYQKTNNSAKSLLIKDLNSISRYVTNPKYRDVFAFTSIFLFIFSGILFLRNYTRNQDSKRTPLLTAILGIAFVIATLVSFNQDKLYAIIISENQPVYESTSGISSSISTLNSGYKLEIIDQADEWLNVILVTGQTGWIKINSAVIV